MDSISAVAGMQIPSPAQQLWRRLQLWLRFDPWPRKSICHRVAKKKKKKKDKASRKNKNGVIHKGICVMYEESENIIRLLSNNIGS